MVIKDASKMPRIFYYYEKELRRAVQCQFFLKMVIERENPM